MPVKSFLRVHEAATILGISRDYLYRCIRTGAIPAVKLGRIWLIPGRFIDELADPEKRSELKAAGQKKC